MTTPAGNGVDKLSAEEISKKAMEALKERKIFNLKGNVKDDGDTVALDLTISDRNVAGKVDIEGVPVQLVSVGDDLYIKGLDRMLAALIPDATALAALKDKYVKVNGKDGLFAAYAEMADPDQFIDFTEGTFTKGEAKTVNGVPAIALIDDSKAVLYVATEGEPLPLQIAGPDGVDVLNFSYEGLAPVKAPDAANVVDISTLMPKS